MENNLKIILILADILSLPRNGNRDIVKYYNTWPSQLNQNLKNLAEHLKHQIDLLMIATAVSHDKFGALDIDTLKESDAVEFDIKAFFDVSEIDTRL